MSITYKQAGVDVGKAEQFVKKLKNITAGCLQKNILAFGSPYDLKRLVKQCRHPVLVSSTDGVGTKLMIAQQANIHHTVGIDLVAMNVNDLICLGARPLFFLDYIACGKLKPSVLTQVVQGIMKGLRQSDCALLGGETAEMPGMYKKDEYDLAGFCVGIVDKPRLIDGKSIKEKDVVIGLASSGLHSNGFSLVRRVFTRAEIKKYAWTLLCPTRIYVKPILSLLDAVNKTRPLAVKGIAHNTGGAFYDKITKILPPGLGFKVYKNSWNIPRIFTSVQERSGLGDKEMYSTFNMGIGMIIVTHKKHAGKIMRFLKIQKVASSIVGEVIKTKRDKVVFV